MRTADPSADRRRSSASRTAFVSPPPGDYFFLVEIVQSLQVIGDVINRADKEKQQLKIEVEQAKEQLENVVKAKVRKFQQQLRQIAIIWS